MTRTWPDDWERRKAGEGCPMCAEGRPDTVAGSALVYRSSLVDAYLRAEDLARGYTVVAWRGDHVAEPTELSPEVSARFWGEVMKVATAIEQVFRPAKLNIDLLGNAVPHLHAHVIPRYLDDTAPGRPPVFLDREDLSPIPAHRYSREVAALRAAIDEIWPDPAVALRAAKRVGAAAVIVDEAGKVLLVRQAYGERQWSLPGGLSEPGESPEQTLARELKEELGIKIGIERLSGIYHDPDHRLGEMLHFAFRCDVERDAAIRKLDGEIDAYGQWPPDDLPNPISELTVRRIRDALTDEPVTIAAPPWLGQGLAGRRRRGETGMSAG